MSYTKKDIKIKASTDEIAAIKLALASIIYSLHTPFHADLVLNTLRSSENKAVKDLADELAKLAPDPLDEQ